MKTLSTGLLLLVSGLLFVSCSKKDKIVPALSADKTTVNATAQAGMEYLQISSNTDWTISGMPSWLTVTPASGNGDTRVEFSFTANTGSNDRSANLSLSSTGGTAAAPVTIVISQLQAPVVITSFTEHEKGGATITITGSGFSDVIAENIVKINDKPATVTAATPTSLSVTVPAKAGDGKIAITIGSKSITTTNNFLYDWVGVVTTFAGDGNYYNLWGVSDVVTDQAGNVYVTESQNLTIRKFSPNGSHAVLAGRNRGFGDAKGENASFNVPFGLAIDGNGNLFVADKNNHAIRKITPDGTVTTIAGKGSAGAVNGNVANATFNHPSGLAVDGNGNIYVADQDNHMIRKIATDGTVTTLAGSLTQGSADGNGAAAGFYYPSGIAIDGGGNLFVADYYNQRIRKISPNGAVTTIAGSSQGSNDGQGVNARFQYPAGLAVDGQGNIYVADRDNNRIRKISATGRVTTLAGDVHGFADGTGAQAQFFLPREITVDANGVLYVADETNYRIRKIIQQ